MAKSDKTSWLRLVVSYWGLLVVVFALEFKYMNSDWAGLPGFLLTLPLSTVVVSVFLLPAIAARAGYQVQPNLTEYQAEIGFMICAFVNAFMLYPFYAWWKNRKRTETFEAPPPPGLEAPRMHDSEHG